MPPLACCRDMPQEFMPEPETYDVIWCQWVVGHLHDVDFVKFVRRCRAALRPGGVIVMKDNVCVGGSAADSADAEIGEGEAFVVDSDDSSVTRSEAYFRILFREAGVDVLSHMQQKDFPDEIFPVHTFAVA